MNVIIIIPTYNENKNIPILIDRIRKLKTEFNLEILVIDDASPDGTSDSIKKIQ